MAFGVPSVRVPLDLLLTRELTPAAKLIWIHLRLDEMRRKNGSLSPAHLARRAGLARSTVYVALNALPNTGWCYPHREPASSKRLIRTGLGNPNLDRFVLLPLDLVEAAQTLRPQAILCFGLLQAVDRFQGRQGRFKWADLQRLTELHLKTLKNAVRELADAGWATLRQPNRLAPLHFTLHHPDEAWKQAAERRLKRHRYAGQALMQEFLTLIVDSQEFVEDASTGFLINPHTQHLLQFDRF